jgi:hypothetical protein
LKLPKELREKKELTGSSGKGKKCSVKDCNKKAIRSLNENKWAIYLEKADLKYDENKNRKIYLCKEHYKDTNKLRKSEEKLYQKKGFLDNSTATRKGKWDY